MTENEFLQLSGELKQLAANAPQNWGRIQNNAWDRLVNFFAINSYTQLKQATARLTDEQRLYVERRWWVWQCSQCDEYLFYCNPGVTQNPNRYDKSWDISFDGAGRYDIKGTIIPRDMRNNANGLLQQPQPMVDFFYEQQSKGVRYGLQNRLFIVHHSLVSQQHEPLLRTAWDVKRQAFADLSAHIGSITPLSYKNLCQALVVFIIEQPDGSINYHF